MLHGGKPLQRKSFLLFPGSNTGLRWILSLKHNAVKSSYDWLDGAQQHDIFPLRKLKPPGNARLDVLKNTPFYIQTQRSGSKYRVTQHAKWRQLKLCSKPLSIKQLCCIAIQQSTESHIKARLWVSFRPRTWLIPQDNPSQTKMHGKAQREPPRHLDKHQPRTCQPRACVRAYGIGAQIRSGSATVPGRFCGIRRHKQTYQRHQVGHKTGLPSLKTESNKADFATSRMKPLQGAWA